MKVFELYPGSRTIEIDPATTSVNTASIWYPKIQGVRFNFVASAREKQTETSDQSTNALDRFFLKLIRSASDLIITTGKTARAETLQSSKFAPLAILTKHPNELDIPATSVNSSLAVLICSSFALTRKYANENLQYIFVESLDSAEVIQEIINTVGSKETLLEVGASTASSLAERNFLDEICLSVTGSNSRQEATSFAELFLTDLKVRSKIIQLLASEDIFLFRYQVLK